MLQNPNKFQNASSFMGTSPMPQTQNRHHYRSHKRPQNNITHKETLYIHTPSQSTAKSSTVSTATYSLIAGDPNSQFVTKNTTLETLSATGAENKQNNDLVAKLKPHPAAGWVRDRITGRTRRPKTPVLEKTLVQCEPPYESWWDIPGVNRDFSFNRPPSSGTPKAAEIGVAPDELAPGIPCSTFVSPAVYRPAGKGKRRHSSVWDMIHRAFGTVSTDEYYESAMYSGQAAWMYETMGGRAAKRDAARFDMRLVQGLLV